MAVDTTALTTGADVTAPVQGARKGKRRRLLFLRNAKAITGMAILGFFGVLAVIGPWIAPYDPSAVSTAILKPPSAQHWLGTTHLGQDVLSQIVVGTRGVMVVGLIAGVVATAMGVLIGVTAGYIGGAGDETLSALSNVFLVIPQAPADHHHRRASAVGRRHHRRDGDRADRLGVGRSRAACPDALAAPSGLRGGRPRQRREHVAHHHQRDPAQPDGDHRQRVRRHRGVRRAVADHARVHRRDQRVQAELGTILFWAQGNLALQRGAWWWFVPAGLCIALLGTGLTLINFGIDEFVNPRLRSTGLNAGSLRRRGIRPRIGFTPVVHEAKEDRA